jgi:general secretion pathway protein G
MLVRPLSHRLPTSRREAFTLLEVMVVLAILVIIASLATFAVVRNLADAKEKQAKLQMQKIEQACKTYFAESGGNWPQGLEELIRPSDGRQPLLEGGESAITDPWNKPYLLDLTSDDTGATRVVVTTTNERGIVMRWPEK